MASISVSVPSARLAEELSDIDGADVFVWKMDAASPRPRIDIVVPPYMSGNPLGWLEGVEVGLVQGQAIGYDGIEDRLPAGVVFANAATVHEAATAELAVALTLTAQRSIDRFVRAQASGDWGQISTAGLADRRVMVLGYGGVGKAVAARLAPFEIDLVAVASSARDENGIHVHSVDELPDLLPGVDIVIVTLPGGDATRHIVDDGFLSALAEGALVVNVGRGTLVDTDALVAHVKSRGIRAALDVTDPEPLPADHPLWSLEGVVIAPHVGGATDAMHPRIVRLLRRQIGHVLAGEAPENVVIRT